MQTRAGQKIHAHRTEARPKLTQEAFGERYGVSFQTVWNWENGQRKPNLSTMLALEADGICEVADWNSAARADDAEAA